MKRGRGAKLIKTEMRLLEGDKQFDTSLISDEIDNLTTKAGEEQTRIQNQINSLPDGGSIDELQKEILTSFRKFKCPQFIFPCPKIEIAGETKSQPGCIFSAPMIFSFSHFADVRNKLVAELNKFTGGRGSKGVGDDIFSAASASASSASASASRGGGGKNIDNVSVKQIGGDDDFFFTQNERAIIYTIYTLINDGKSTPFEMGTELYIRYCHIIDTLEYYKNLNDDDTFLTWPDDDKYAIDRLERAFQKELGESRRAKEVDVESMKVFTEIMRHTGDILSKVDGVIGDRMDVALQGAPSDVGIKDEEPPPVYTGEVTRTVSRAASPVAASPPPPPSPAASASSVEDYFPNTPDFPISFSPHASPTARGDGVQSESEMEEEENIFEEPRGTPPRKRQRRDTNTSHGAISPGGLPVATGGKKRRTRKKPVKRTRNGRRRYTRNKKRHYKKRNLNKKKPKQRRTRRKNQRKSKKGRKTRRNNKRSR